MRKVELLLTLPFRTKWINREKRNQKSYFILSFRDSDSKRETMKLQGEKMKFYIHKKFWNNIINLQEVEEKLKKFSIEMENNNFIYQNLSKGWYVKKIETNSNQLFEFRVNQSDRIMFTLNNLTIKYLCWNNHDTAVLNGKKLENLENTMFIEYLCFATFFRFFPMLVGQCLLIIFAP